MLAGLSSLFLIGSGIVFSQRAAAQTPSGSKLPNPKSQRLPAQKKKPAAPATTESKPKAATTPPPPAATAAPNVSNASNTTPSVPQANGKITKYESDLKNNPKNASLLYALVQEYYAQKQYKKVTETVWKHIDSADRRSLILMAQSHLKGNEFTDTIKIGKMLISKDEKDEEAYTLMGWAYLNSNKPKEALEHFNKATQINGIYQPAYDGLIKLYEQKGNLYELRILYQDMLEKFGQKGEFLNELCKINTKDNLNDYALDYCKKAIGKSPEYADNHVYFGLVLLNIGEQAKAQEKLKYAAEHFTNSVLAQETYANYLHDKSDSIGSYKYYSNCLALEPANEKCLISVSHAAIQIEKIPEAYEKFKKICSKDRKYAIEVRKAIKTLKDSKKTEWVAKFEDLSEKCMLK